jgi:hypothetical protein
MMMSSKTLAGCSITAGSTHLNMWVILLTTQYRKSKSSEFSHLRESRKLADSFLGSENLRNHLYLIVTNIALTTPVATVYMREAHHKHPSRKVSMVCSIK